MLCIGQIFLAVVAYGFTIIRTSNFHNLQQLVDDFGMRYSDGFPYL
jgi:hypothetical protein